MKVLIVDDSAPIRSLARNILAAGWSIDVVECGDGRAALKTMKELAWRPDLVLIDYEMTPMNGVEFTRLLRSGQAGAPPGTPVIMMTGHTDRERMLAARKAGVDGVVAKPLTIRAVLERVQAVLDRQRDVVMLPIEHVRKP
jgi:two-component system, chemotaxis family, chemotaxis protein CheY